MTWERFVVGVLIALTVLVAYLFWMLFRKGPEL